MRLQVGECLITRALSRRYAVGNHPNTILKTKISHPVHPQCFISTECHYDEQQAETALVPYTEW